MNLHSVVSGAVAAVNPFTQVTLKRDVGFTENPDFSRSPKYECLPVSAQIQAMTSDDVKILSDIGIQGYKRKIYLFGSFSGIIRGLQKGNDLIIFPDKSEWKIVYVFEDFGHGLVGKSGWCSVAVTLQNPKSEG